MREGVETGLAVIGAHAAFADTAERKVKIEQLRENVVDRGPAGRDRAQRFFLQRRTGGEKIERERFRTLLQGIEFRVDIVVSENRQDRTENLVGHHRVIPRHFGQHCRCDIALAAVGLAAGNDLAARILEWRQLSKLKSTYTDLLPGYIHPGTQRVHTSYALASTTTGRLSSSEPNLQNIPIRTEEGRRIRTAFIAAPGMKLVSADYSQIELRVVAHVADIPQLKQAFADGLDIHAMTASEMFGVPVKGMPAEVRRRAKAINFGIIYGISAFGLANQLGIARQEAGDYINRYFERFPGIKDYMEAMRKQVRADGYVATLFGRKIHFAAANARNPAERAFIDRAAINAPIQGSAADIIRRAMVRMEPALEAARLSAAMLLQVHDELVFEVPESEVAATLPVVTRVMEAAADPVVQLSVPLQVDAKAGDNWDAAH